MKTHVLEMAAVIAGSAQTSSAFVTPFLVRGAVNRAVASKTTMAAARVAIPLELEGVLDSAREWEIEMDFDGDVRTLTVKEGTSVLNAAKSVYDNPPHSCQNGICTTCAGLIREGKEGENYKVAVDALGPDQRAEGFTLTCQTYPCGPGLKVALNQFDRVYDKQYGQYELKEKRKGFMGLF